MKLGTNDKYVHANHAASSSGLIKKFFDRGSRRIRGLNSNNEKSRPVTNVVGGSGTTIQNAKNKTNHSGKHGHGLSDNTAHSLNAQHRILQERKLYKRYTSSAHKSHTSHESSKTTKSKKSNSSIEYEDPENNDPVALDDVFRTFKNTALEIEAPGLLTNDINCEGETLTIKCRTLPDNGALLLRQNGSFCYTPNNNFYGVDTFTYSVSNDNGAISKAIVSITVEHVNTAEIVDAVITPASTRVPTPTPIKFPTSTSSPTHSPAKILTPTPTRLPKPGQPTVLPSRKAPPFFVSKLPSTIDGHAPSYYPTEYPSPSSLTFDPLDIPTVAPSVTYSGDPTSTASFSSPSSILSMSPTFLPTQLSLITPALSVDPTFAPILASSLSISPTTSPTSLIQLHATFTYRVHLLRELPVQEVENGTYNTVLLDLVSGFNTLYTEFKRKDKNGRYLRFVLGGGLEVNHVEYRDSECVDETNPPSIHCIMITSEVKVEASKSNSLQSMESKLLNTSRYSMSPVSPKFAKMVNNPDVIKVVFLKSGIMSPVLVYSNLEDENFTLDLAGIARLLIGSSFFICFAIVVIGNCRKKYNRENSDKLLSVSTEYSPQNMDNIDSSFASEQNMTSTSPDISQMILSLEKDFLDVDAALGVTDYSTVSKIAADKSSNCDAQSLSSSHDSSQVLSTNGNFISLFPPILPGNKNSQISSEEERRLNLEMLIAAGDWDAVATAAAIYESDASTISSTVSNRPTTSQNTKDHRKRPFLDYVVGRPWTSTAASAAIEHNRELEGIHAPTTQVPELNQRPSQTIIYQTVNTRAGDDNPSARVTDSNHMLGDSPSTFEKLLKSTSFQNKDIQVDPFDATSDSSNVNSYTIIGNVLGSLRDEELDKAIEAGDLEAIETHVTKTIELSISALVSEDTGARRQDASSVSSGSLVSEAPSDIQASEKSVIYVSVDNDERIRALESLVDSDDWKGLSR